MAQDVGGDWEGRGEDAKGRSRRWKMMRVEGTVNVVVYVSMLLGMDGWDGGKSSIYL